MKTKLLEVYLKQIGKSLVYAVIDQGNNQRKVKDVLTFDASNGWSIESASYPYISTECKKNRIIGIRGNNTTLDDYVTVLECNTKLECEETLREIRAALTEWAENGGFQAVKKPAKPSNSSDNFAFYYVE